MHITIPVMTKPSYSVVIGAKCINDLGGNELFFGRRVMVVSDDRVFPLYGKRLLSIFERTGISCEPFVFPHGEENKNLTIYEKLLAALSNGGYDRSDVIVAFGGGVVGDLAGFAAATYQRGMGFVQVPTTLLAAVDACVGGKTAVNLPTGKNQVGAFYQPLHVCCDLSLQATLPDIEFRNGCAEIIKTAMIAGGELYKMVAYGALNRQLVEVIAECVRVKARIVAEDERDHGQRQLLNFGHTVGHAIERCSGYAIPHGQAVAMGMATVTQCAAAHKDCELQVLTNLRMLLERYHLPIACPFPMTQIVDVAWHDKKRCGEKLTVVVPRAIGDCVLMEMGRQEFENWLRR